MKHAPLILASASPRRVEILARLGVVPDVIIPAEVDEAALPDEGARGLVQRLAKAKAEAVAADHPNAFVLGADTVVARGRRLLGKPQDEAQARLYLELLSGRRHHVWGGIALVRPDGRVSLRVVDTVVRFKRLSQEEIRDYLASAQWHDKAGGYAMQGGAAAFVDFVRGSPTNVLGLCAYTVMQMLRGAGFRNTN